MNILPLNYKHQKMQPDKFDAWKNKSLVWKPCRNDIGDMKRNHGKVGDFVYYQ